MTFPNTGLPAFVCISMVMLLVLAPVAEAKITFSGADGKPLKPDDPQVKALNDQINKCAAKSRSFSSYVKGVPPSADGPPGGIDKDSKAIDIQFVQDAGVLDNAVNRKEKGKIQINMDNLNRLPDPEMKNGKLDPPPGTPWGLTRCEQLQHIIAEAHEMLYGADLNSAHQKATHIQEAVRIDFKIDKPGAPCHTQRFADPDNPKDKVQPKTIHYVDEGGPHDVTPAGQVQIDYGNSNVEVIWFDNKDRLQLAFFHGNTQIPRAMLTLPATGPDGKNLAPYVFAPNLQGKGGEQYAVATDCNPPPKEPTAAPAPKQTCVKESGILGAIDNETCQIQHS